MCSPLASIAALFLAAAGTAPAAEALACSSGALRHQALGLALWAWASRTAAAAGRGSARAARGGDAVCGSDSGGTCVALSCHAGRGPTKCVGGRCLCQDGFCAVNGACKMATASQCSRQTGGTCSYVRCGGSRGPTECQDGRCVCKAGLCASEGRCSLPRSNLTAAVVPINASWPKFPGPQGSVATALCFSGGGARSLSLTMGAFRALEGLGLMPAVDAISSVSGGSWAAAIYMFADAAVEDLLGASMEPAQLTLPVLRSKPPAMGAPATVSVPLTALRLQAQGVPPHRLWQQTVGALYLAPFGLANTTSFLAADAGAAERIAVQNPQLWGMGFVTPRPGRPRTFVINAALLAPAGYLASESNVVSFQMSPDFTGSPFHPKGGTVSYKADDLHDEPLKNVFVGGGMVESFAFGGPAPLTGRSGSNKATIAAPALPFTLVDAIGISSAAYASQLTTSMLAPSSLVPRADVWAVSSQEHGDATPARTYTLGDGGNIENGGLLAMLQRRAQRIAWWINTDTGISRDVDFCGAVLPGATVVGLTTNQLYDKFGYGGFAGEFYSNNQVFRQEELPKLLCDFRRLIDAGRPAVLRRSLEVQENAWWGITAYTVDLTLVYNERCTDFESSLPPITRTSLAEGILGDFANFPMYKTTFNNGITTPISLSAAQINLLAAQAEYFVRQNAAIFRDLLRK